MSNYSGMLLYPSAQGISKTPYFEALRDGLEDYDYLALLREALKNQPAGARAARAGAVARAEEILADGWLEKRLKNPQDLAALRDTVGDLLESLTLE